jgi:hypothetical protein
MERGSREGTARGHSRLLVALVGVASIVCSVSTPMAIAAEAPDPMAFPGRLSPDLPFDVDIERLGVLIRADKIPEAQRLFDIFAWQAFVALNWPAIPDGSPDRSKTIADSTAPRVWMGWRTNESVFRPDGSRPEPWDSAREIAVKDHYLWRFSKMLDERRSPANELTTQVTLAEFVQAFTGPLVDLNGKFVRYESYLDKPQFDYIVTNELYNQEGQVEFVSTKGQPIRFPVGQAGREPMLGSMGIKLAWKQLGDNDIPSRFFTRQAIVVSTSFDKEGNMLKTQSKELMGLVGMHVTALTQSAPNWIWSTFEHVDNVVANDLETGTALNGKPQRVHPSFNNTGNPSKQVNFMPPMNAPPNAMGGFTTWDEKKTTDPAQLTRVVPIPPATQSLNRQVQGLLRELGSVFQYYELVGAQWPIQPGFPAFAGGANSAPESILFKAPGRVVPVYNVNTAMESYFQRGNGAAGPLEEDDRLPPGGFADRPTEPVTPDRTIVFGTESCVGCHYSAGSVIAFKRDANGKLVRDPDTGLKIPVYGERGNFGQNGNGGYFWQMQLKARQKEPPGPKEKAASAKP